MIFQFHRCPVTGVGPPPGIEIVSVGYIRGGSSTQPCRCASCISSDRLSAYYKATLGPPNPSFEPESSPCAPVQAALGLPDGGPGAVYIQDCLQGLPDPHMVDRRHVSPTRTRPRCRRRHLTRIVSERSQHGPFSRRPACRDVRRFTGRERSPGCRGSPTPTSPTLP